MGKTSEDYAKFRDIYPQEFYDKIVNRQLCINGQNVLDVGTGTGVLPRNMYRYGARWTGTDISVNQIEQAKILSRGMDIEYSPLATENIDFPDNFSMLSLHVSAFGILIINRFVISFSRMLKPGGRILVLYMAWLPFEDEIAGESERLVLKYSPKWSGAGETIHPIDIPDCYKEKF